MADVPDPSRRSLLFGRFGNLSRPAEAPVAVIGKSCFAFHGIACMSCRDTCSFGAIRFELAVGGARPRIDAGACTACGECSLACPAHAIGISMPEETS